jgi:hypothetical protein
MSTIEKRIDQSVNFSTENTFMKNFNNYIPVVPISKAEQLKSALVKRFSAEYAGVATALSFKR